MEVSKNGQEFADYVKLLAFSGARRNEALRLKWSAVDWQNGQLTIGADGLNKGREVRVVDFNQKLKEHLHDMSKRQGAGFRVFVSFAAARRDGRPRQDVHGKFATGQKKIRLGEHWLPRLPSLFYQLRRDERN